MRLVWTCGWRLVWYADSLVFCALLFDLTSHSAASHVDELGYHLQFLCCGYCMASSLVYLCDTSITPLQRLFVFELDAKVTNMGKIKYCLVCATYSVLGLIRVSSGLTMCHTSLRLLYPPRTRTCIVNIDIGE